MMSPLWKPWNPWFFQLMVAARWKEGCVCGEEGATLKPYHPLEKKGT